LLGSDLEVEQSVIALAVLVVADQPPIGRGVESIVLLVPESPKQRGMSPRSRS
jgi:hypothetical protein